MAWIESHQTLLNHPKTLDLMRFMEWDKATTVGKLHMFWWWCLDYAPDGDLTKHPSQRIAQAVEVQDHEKFMNAMIESGYIDTEPYLRVHEWWDYIGLFLQRRYGKKNEKKWKEVQELYSDCTTTVRKGVHQLAQPNQTNQTTPKVINNLLKNRNAKNNNKDIYRRPVDTVDKSEKPTRRGRIVSTDPQVQNFIENTASEVSA
jgi:hypothetical protein